MWMSLVIERGKTKKTKACKIFSRRCNLSWKQNPSFKGNGLCLTLCLHLLTGTSNCWNMEEIFQKGWWTCSLCVHSFCTGQISPEQPLFISHFSNDTASGLLKVPAINGGCFGAISQADQFSLCVPVLLFKSAVWAWNSSSSHHLLFDIVEQPESTQPGLLWGKTTWETALPSASLSLGKLWMFSTWGTARAGQQNHPQKGDGWRLGTHCFVLHWPSLEMSKC